MHLESKIAFAVQTECTHTHGPFNGPFSRTTQVSRYQKGKTNLDFTEARDSEWQWHQPGHMQVCTLFQTDSHTGTPPLFFTGRMPFLPPNQQRQSNEGMSNRVQYNIFKKYQICSCFFTLVFTGGIFHRQTVGDAYPSSSHLDPPLTVNVEVEAT